MTIKAVGLLSGGLDSTLAAKLMLNQGIEVHAINFTSPFCTCTAKGASCANVIKAVEQLGNIPLKRVALQDDYLLMVKSPKHGYGRAINPCIDCRIMKIKKAGEYMREIGASFLFTGEVLGQRPMSQHRRAMAVIDRDSELGGLILRPLSAGLFEPTIPENQGLVDRNKLLAFSGRTRKPQFALAAETGIADYPCPAGGCRLTNKEFFERLKDYFAYVNIPLLKDMPLLKIGRHFRLENGSKLMCARDEQEGLDFIRLRQGGQTIIAADNFGAPVMLFSGNNQAAALAKMMEYTHQELPQDARVQIHGDTGIEVRLLSELCPA